jgi:hypothetical protein
MFRDASPRAASRRYNTALLSFLSDAPAQTFPRPAAPPPALPPTRGSPSVQVQKQEPSSWQRILMMCSLRAGRPRLSEQARSGEPGQSLHLPGGAAQAGARLSIFPAAVARMAAPAPSLCWKARRPSRVRCTDVPSSALLNTQGAGAPLRSYGPTGIVTRSPAPGNVQRHVSPSPLRTGAGPLSLPPSNSTVYTLAYTTARRESLPLPTHYLSLISPAEPAPTERARTTSPRDSTAGIWKIREERRLAPMCGRAIADPIQERAW